MTTGFDRFAAFAGANDFETCFASNTSLARRVGLLDRQPDVAQQLAPRGALDAHGLQRLHPPFVARPPRLDALPQPHFLFGELLVEFALQRRLVRECLFLPPQIGRVVSGPRRQLPAVDFHNARGEALQERTVVRDEHDGAGILGEKLFEPGDRFDVEMIRRLVEQQQLGLRHERTSEQHTPPPAARERIDNRFRRQLKPFEHQLDALLEIPAVLLLELVLKAAQPIERRFTVVATGGHLVHGMVIRRDHIAQGAQPIGHDVEYRAMRGQRDILLEPRDANARLAPHRSGVGRQLAAEDTQQRRFTRPVAANQRHALARLNLHG